MIANDPRRIAGIFALAVLAAHLLTGHRYGYFRDELYFLACGEHLDWGYVDHAPLVAVYAWVGRNVFGESVLGIRVLPALAAALKVLLTGALTLQFGGGAFAVMLACLAVVIAPGYLAIDKLMTMNAFEPLYWMGAVSAALAAMRRNPRWWLAAGAALGLGLENKHATAFFGIALLLGLLLGRQSRVLREKWLWAGVAVAALIALPNVWWQMRHGWPTLEMLANVKNSGKNVVLNPAAFLAQQILLLSPLSVLVWGGGLWHLLRDRSSQWMAWTYLCLLALMIALEGKHYYLLPAYPMLLAAGGVFWSRFPSLWVRAGLPAAIAITTLPLVPFVIPVLPVETLLWYQDAIRFQPPKTEVAHTGRLQQDYGDMFGWPEMVDAVARVYHGLPEEERRKAAIFAGNYGEAGAIDFFGPRLGLPKAISGHQNYFLWGPRDYNGDVLIVLQLRKASVEPLFESVEVGPRVGHLLAMAEENFDILICRGLKVPVAELWPKVKAWR